MNIVLHMEWVAAFVHLNKLNCCANNGIILGILYNVMNEHLM